MMKFRFFLPAVLSLLLFLTACGPSEEEDPSRREAVLWFAAQQQTPGSSALGQETRILEERPPEDREEYAELLLNALFDGPASPALLSPFPADTALLGLSVRGGLARVNLSESYGGLYGVDLTLADACVVLTLCQIPGISRVYLMVEGAPRPFRDQIFLPGDFMLDNTPLSGFS